MTAPNAQLGPRSASRKVDESSRIALVDTHAWANWGSPSCLPDAHYLQAVQLSRDSTETRTPQQAAEWFGSGQTA